MSRSFSGVVTPLLLAALAAAPLEAATMRAFVTSTTCSGDLGPCSAAVGDSGVAAANNICQERAAAAGLDAGGQVFRAWTSDSTVDAWCNVLGLSGQRYGTPPCGVPSLPDAGPWVLLDGVPFAASLAHLVTDPALIGPITPLGIDEFGAAVPTSFALTGSLYDGTLRATHNCSDWTSASGSVAGGNTDVGSWEWAAGASTSCVGPFRIHCFEVGAGDSLSYPSAAGALAFVTSATGSGDLATWADSGGSDGLAGGDAVCQALAGAADLPFPTSFVALLSDGATDAEARLTLDGPWERVDGVPIAESKADLLDGTLDGTLVLNELDGRYQADAWTGTSESGLSTGIDCLGWSSDLSSENGTPGRPWRSENAWTGTGAGTAACNLTRHLFCFSNQLLLGWDSFESGDFFRWPLVVGGP